MKKILFVTHYVYIGGGEIALLDLITALKELDFKVVIIIPEIGPLFYEAKAQSIDVRVEDMPLVGKKMIKYPLRFLKCVLRLMRIIRREDISYIFANHLNAGIYAAIAAKPFGIKSIWYCWGRQFPKDKFWQHVYRILFDKIVFPSNCVKEKMRINTFRQDELIVIHPGIDVKRVDGDSAYSENSFKKEYRIPEDHLIFSIIGRVDSCKNHLMFLDVADEIIRQYPKSYFVIAGGDNENDGGDSHIKSELEKKIKSTPSLTGRVVFTGFIRDVKKIIKSSKVIFSCSGNEKGEESFGLVMVEAMISGRPVIATSIGGPAEIIIDGVNGYLVPPGDYKAMAKKAIDLVSSQLAYDKIVENAKTQALERYTVERFARKIANMYLQNKK